MPSCGRKASRHTGGKDPAATGGTRATRVIHRPMGVTGICCTEWGLPKRMDEKGVEDGDAAPDARRRGQRTLSLTSAKMCPVASRVEGGVGAVSEGGGFSHRCACRCARCGLGSPRRTGAHRPRRPGRAARAAGPRCSPRRHPRPPSAGGRRRGNLPRHPLPRSESRVLSPACLTCRRRAEAQQHLVGVEKGGALRAPVCT